MPRIAKIALCSFGGLLAVLILVGGYVAATFNPNEYKPAVIKLVKEKTGRTLSIPGELKLTFYPKIGADLGKVALSEKGSEAEFAAIENAKVSLALLPLLKKDVVVDRVTVNGARAHVIRFADGTMNIDDLMAKKEEDKSEPVKFAIDSVKIGNASVHYEDRKEGKDVQLSAFNLDTGAIANGAQSKAALSANIKLSKPAMNVAVVLKTGFTIDTDKKHYMLKGLDATISGAFAPYEKIDLSASGDVALDLAASKFRLADLKLGANARKATQTLEAKLALPAFDGSSKDIKLPGLSIDVAIKDTGLDARARLSGDVSADLDAMKFNAPSLKLTVDGKKDALAIAGQFAASLVADLKANNIDFGLKGKLDDSNIDAKAGMRAGALNFALNADKLDVERYAVKSAPPPANAPEAEIDLSGLKGLNASGSIRIGSLKAAGLQASELAVDVHGSGNSLSAAPIRAKLYGGTLNASVSLDFSADAKRPRISAKKELTGIKLGAMLKDVMKKDLADGTGDIAVDVSTQGATVSAMRKALNGTARLRLADGSVSGFNLAQMIRNAKAAVGAGAKTGTSSAADKTDFTELTGSFRIANGVAHNDDLSAKTPLFRVGGAGDIDIGRETIDYTVKATVVATLQGQGGPELQSLKGVTVPVKLTGPMAAMQWHIDFAAMATDTVKAKVQDKLKDTLQNLFKR